VSHQVITREVDGHKCEPYEEAVVEVPENYVGGIVELFAQRKGEMVDMQPSIQVSWLCVLVKSRAGIGVCITWQKGFIQLGPGSWFVLSWELSPLHIWLLSCHIM
jgi:predicted membrane GTPase involved in stress response